jgi:hypothetical protein
MTLTYFLIYSLATWRVASLLVQEDGPFRIFRRLRELTGIQHDDDLGGDIYLVPDTFLAGILSCVWCCSIWAAIVWTLLWFLIPDISIWMAIPFGISGGAILMDKWTTRV